MRWYHGLLGLVGLVAVAVVGVVIYVATLDLEAYRTEIQQAVADQTGRTLSIDGEMALEWTPGPSVSLSDVRFANAEWAAEPDMLTVGSLQVAVQFWPLLSGDFHIDGVTISDVALRLEKNDAGAGNWQGLAQSDGAGSGQPGAVPQLKSLALENVTLTWKAGPQDAEQVYRLETLSLASESFDDPLDIEVKGDLAGQGLELEGRIPRIVDLLKPGLDHPVALSGEFGDQELSIDALVMHETGERGQRVEAKDLAVTFGEISGTGTASVVLSDPRPRIDASLALDRVDLAAFEADEDGSDGGADPMAAPLPLDALKAVDANVTLSVAGLDRDPYTVDDLKMALVLEAGLLEISSLTGVVEEGALKASGRVDAGADTPRMALDVDLIGVNLGSLVNKASGSDALDASGLIEANLSSIGTTPNDLIAALDGTTALIVQDGVVRNKYWELIADDLASRLLPSLDEAPRGNLTCAVAAYDIKGGVAETRVLLIDSDRVTVAGEGSINLAARTLEMRLVPEPKNAALVSLATPILISGPLEDPSFAPDPVAVAKGIGTAVVGTTINPLGLLLPFVDRGSGESPCPDAIAVAEGRQPTPAPAPSSSSGQTSAPTTTEQPGAVRGLFDSLRRAVE